MKKLILLGAVVLLPALQSPAQSDVIARIHFLGGDRIAADPAHIAFTNEFCSPEARALEKQTLDKLARTPGLWFKSKIPAGAGNDEAQLRPLLDDLLKSEWTLEIRAAGDGSPEYALAIRLNNSRAQLWSRNLSSLLQSWTGLKISPDKAGNWELKKHEAPNLFRFSRIGDWVVLDCGENQLALTDEIRKTFSMPALEWLSADLNWPRLARIFPALRQFDFPAIQLMAIGRNGEMDVSGRLNLSQPLPALSKWQMPAETIHGPFTSFTAVRGVAPWLQRQSWFQPFELQPQPDQMFIWAMPQIPFQTFAAEPVPNAAAALAQLYHHLSVNTNWEDGLMMPMQKTLTKNEIAFKGVPFISPYVRAVTEPAGNFLVGGFFPNTPKGEPLPAEFSKQLNQPNLVYYHWEITSARLKDMPELTQLLLMLTRREQLGGDSPAYKWLKQIGPKLGPSVTRVTETTPTELTFTRTASGGLTAVEFLALASWLESPKFPKFDLRLPERPKLPHLHPKIPGAPAPAPVPPAKH